MVTLVNKVAYPLFRPFPTPNEIYGQRWQVETVFSMIKRRLGAALNAKTYWSQCRALMLKVITHNIMIICYVLWGFLQSTPDPFKSRVRYIC